jgi:hypothetical protein
VWYLERLYLSRLRSRLGSATGPSPPSVASRERRRKRSKGAFEGDDAVRWW